MDKSYEEIQNEYFTRVVGTYKAKSQKMYTESKEKLQKALSREERKRMYYGACIIVDLAFHYAGKAQKLGREYRIPELKALCQEIDKLQSWHAKNKRSRLNDRHMNLIRCNVEKIIGKFVKDKASGKTVKKGGLKGDVLYNMVYTCFRKNCPDHPYPDVTSNAIISKLFIDYLAEFGNESINLLNERTHEEIAPFNHSPQVEALESAMIAYAGAEDFNYQDSMVQIAMKGIKTVVKSIKFRFYTLPNM